MTGLATQLHMLAQGPNFEDWGDVLIIAVMAILWLAGALAKVLTSRKGAGRQQQDAAKPQRQRETWQQRLARKAEEMQRAAEARSRSQQEARARSERASTQAPRPPAGRVTIRQGPRGESVMVYERPTAQPDAEQQQQALRQREAWKAVLAARRRVLKAPPVEPRMEVGSPASLPTVAAMSEPPRPPEPEIARVETPREPMGGVSPSAIIDYSDPDALRKAILHYEILGKPLALRESSEVGDSF